MAGGAPARAQSTAADMRSGSEPWKAKIACFRSPTQMLRRAMAPREETTASWRGEASWNSSTATRSPKRSR